MHRAYLFPPNPYGNKHQPKPLIHAFNGQLYSNLVNYHPNSVPFLRDLNLENSLPYHELRVPTDQEEFTVSVVV